ncbi:MAG: carbamoyltransferase C-terminal domain-containing protein [Candidatus Omnitrophica bacterium]|nr:carbamoyltransferase C-terminal domain-containing protein [Candidatus Omnitrophota bacterium]MDD5553686.1 carbamoyltransferase C-terminal domain-containing protein [Candidatus Omnitrophota bacterium]
MYTLGINAAFHDSAACLVKNGKIVAAAEEERFTGIKHGKRPVPFSAYELPFHAIHYCLAQADISIYDLDHIAYSFNPMLFYNPGKTPHHVCLKIKPDKKHKPGFSPWDPLFYLYLLNAPKYLLDGCPHHLQERFRKKGMIFKTQWHYIDHHMAHAASAFLVCPFKSAAILTLDGRGEKVTTTFAVGKRKQIWVIKEISMPHSIGILYEKLTEHLGFLHSSDEYKVMALASFGKPNYRNEFRRMINLKKDGRYEIDYLDLNRLFGPPRKKGAPLKQRHFDIASSLQKALEETVLHMVSWLAKSVKERNLCLSGGVALNCVMNSRIKEKGDFKEIWVQPAAGDAGTALGAAVLVDSNQRSGKRPQAMTHAYFGPEYPETEIERFLAWAKTKYRKLDNIPRQAASLLFEDKIVGWFQGRMEFGPRALGARSILASPLTAEMQTRLNEIKGREDFRPVAPCVLEEEAGKWFKGAGVSPFMLFVYDVIREKKPLIPAVTHIDGTARIQTVNRCQNPLYYDTILSFKKLSGVPILINTSFNINSKPIVCSPQDALGAFWASPIDALIMGPFLIEKS